MKILSLSHTHTHLVGPRCDFLGNVLNSMNIKKGKCMKVLKNRKTYLKICLFKRSKVDFLYLDPLFRHISKTPMFFWSVGPLVSHTYLTYTPKSALSLAFNTPI